MSARTPEAVLQRVAGWEGASLTELKGGLNNRTWLAQRDGRKAVLKVDQDIRDRPYNSRPEEARTQSLAASVGLAGEILYVDETALMCAWTEGEVGDSVSLSRHDVIERVAAALRRLHGLAPTGRTFDAMGAARLYFAGIRNDDDGLAAESVRIVESVGKPQILVLCHNDLVAANIIIAPRARFLDWEYACDNDPLFDIATLIEHHALSEAAAARLLDAYFDGDGERWRGALDVQRRLYAALNFLWQAWRASQLPAVP